jgi:hypothetical protein
MVNVGYWSAEELAQQVTQEGSIELTYTDSRARVDVSRLKARDMFAPIAGGFILHPPMPGENSTIIFRNVAIENRRRFTARASIENAQATQGIVFAVTIEAAGVQIATEQCTVHPDEIAEFDVSIETGEATIDVVLTTEMDVGAANNYYSWATWSDARIS